MTLKNIIINKSLRDNDIQIKFDDALLKYVSKLKQRKGKRSTKSTKKTKTYKKSYRFSSF